MSGNGQGMIPVVIVALDETERGPDALATGERLATRTGGDVVAVHVRGDRAGDESGATARAFAAAAEVPLLIRRGEIAEALGDAYLELRACAIVASGDVARAVLERVPIAVAVAPSGANDVEIDLVAAENAVSRRYPDRAERSG
jgi:hypothetical protein